MAERQLGEVPEAAVRAATEAWCGDVLNPDAYMDDGRETLEAACDPALGDQRLVPASAVADAVRAERERVAEALDGEADRRTYRTDGPWRKAAKFVRALPPADGNTEEEG